MSIDGHQGPPPMPPVPGDSRHTRYKRPIHRGVYDPVTATTAQPPIAEMVSAYILKIERELFWWRVFAIILFILSIILGAITMGRITREQAIIEVGEQAIAEVERMLPQATGAPQAIPTLHEFCAVVPAESKTLRAYFYQPAEALRAVDNQLDMLHWSVRDFEVY